MHDPIDPPIIFDCKLSTSKYFVFSLPSLNGKHWGTAGAKPLPYGRELF